MLLLIILCVLKSLIHRGGVKVLFKVKKIYKVLSEVKKLYKKSQNFCKIYNSVGQKLSVRS